MKEVSELNRERGRSRLTLPLLVVLALALGLLALPGCRSLSKAQVTERVLGLEKNAPVRDAGLIRTPLTVRSEDGAHQLELVHLRVGPTAPSSATEAAFPTRPVVLVHGTPSTLAGWTEIVFGPVHGRGESAPHPGLADAREVIAIEVVGHGMAPGTLDSTSFDGCAAFVVAALRSLDLGPVHLVGSSYGGEFVWRAALDAPELVATVALLDSSGYPRPADGFLPEEVEMRENSLADWGYLINSEERVETALAPHFRELPPDRVSEFTLVCSNAANWEAMVDLVRDEDGARAPELPGLELPVLLVWGADDIAYPLETYGRRFAGDLPDAELVVIEAAGHYPHEERPGAVLEALEDFYDRREAALATARSSAEEDRR